MRVLFVMASPEYLRFFDTLIGELAARGHHVMLAVNSSKDKKPVGLDGLRALEPRVEVLGVAPVHEGRWGDLAEGLRGLMDFARYLHPRLAKAPALRARMKRKSTPIAFRWLDLIPSLPAPLVRGLLGGLATAERAIPISPAVTRFIQDARPDVVLVSPLVDAASEQVEWIKAARALGVRTGLLVASWDNLTNKGHLRVVPDRVIVWNEAQRREAIEFHAVPADQVIVTGAQLFDRWFETTPTRDRDAFCARVGLPDAGPFLLFTGSSSFISESNAEVAFVRRWIRALRGSPVPSIREMRVLVRPHPYNCHAWPAADMSDDPGVAVFPRATYSPVNPDTRTDFYDSLHHSAAVVGINTSAMIEAAIVGRPVFSIMAPEFAGTQEGTVHFHYLLPEHGGCVRFASTLDEHVTQIGERLQDPEAAFVETQRFVGSFIRPHGLGRPATPIAADAVEQIGRLGAAVPARPPAAAPVLRPLLLAAGAVSFGVSAVLRPDLAGRVRKQWRHAQKERQKRRARALRQGGSL